MKRKARQRSSKSKRRSKGASTETTTDVDTKWTRTETPLVLPDWVRAQAAKIHDAGFVAYIVGGSIRDHLLGRESKDHDLVTDALPEDLEKIFPEALDVGKSFGVFKIPSPEEQAPPLEVASFREDGEYGDHRHPKSVSFSGPIEDSKRRDFTVNALYYDLKTHRILDLQNGKEDIQAATLRCIGKAEERFEEDALRVLRAIRLSGQLDFQIEAKTKRAIAKKAELLRKISSERVREELDRCWMGTHPTRCFRNIESLGLLRVILPEVDATRDVLQASVRNPKQTVLERTGRLLKMLAKKEKRSLSLVWAAILHGVGKPIAYRKNLQKNLNGHEKLAIEIAKQIGKRLKIPKATINEIVYIIEHQAQFKEVFQMREATLIRFLTHPSFPLLLSFHEADAITGDGNLANYAFCEKRLKQLRSTPKIKPLIDGDDLIQLGFRPGPLFSQILKDVEDLTLEKKLNSHEEALEFVVKHFVR